MRASAVSAIIFANTHDESMGKLTAFRSMASVPFGGRYRLVDFALSNLVNAGVYNIGIIAKENYRSLMDHIGSGVYWDLDRKSGGIHLMPPFIVGGARRYHGYIEALYGAMDFLRRSNSDYMVLYESGSIANIDLSSAIKEHIDNDADLTVIYTKNKKFTNKTGALVLKLSGNKIISADTSGGGENCAVSLGIYIFNRQKLIKLVESAYQNGGENLEKELIAENIESLNAIGYLHGGFFAEMDCPTAYKSASMALLNKDVRRDLFNPERPIFTKTRDDMPTRYGINSNVKNSFVADGCVIDGEVENSILFRGVRVKKGAKLKNCILMQGVEVGENVCLQYVVSDKNSTIGKEIAVKGTAEKSFFIEKYQNL